MTYRINIQNQADTKKIADKLALFLAKGDLITFKGELGAGKTFFIAQVIRQLMQDNDLIISSPTFNLVHHYTNHNKGVAGDFRDEGRNRINDTYLPEESEKRRTNATSLPSIWHFDLYRLKHLEEIYELGFEETYDGITFIEWPEIILSILPKDRLDINIICGNDDERTITLDPKGSWQDKLKGHFDDK